MEDINMNRPKTAESSHSKTVSKQNSEMQDENRKTATQAAFEDLWSSALDDSPPSSQVSSPVHNHNHAHNQGQRQGQRQRKKKWKIRFPHGNVPLHPSANMNQMERVILDTVVRESLRREQSSSARSARPQHANSSHVSNYRNNAMHSPAAHTKKASAERLNVAAPSSTPTSEQNICKGNRPESSQSRPVSTSAPFQQRLSTQEKTSHSAAGQNLVPKSPQKSPSISNVTAQESPLISPQSSLHSTSAPQGIPQMQPKPSPTVQGGPSAAPNMTLPPGFEYMSDSQKQLFYEYQKQQMRGNQQIPPGVSKQVPSSTPRQQAMPSIQHQQQQQQQKSRVQHVPHSQGVPPTNQQQQSQPTRSQQVSHTPAMHLGIANTAQQHMEHSQTQQPRDQQLQTNQASSIRRSEEQPSAPSKTMMEKRKPDNQGDDTVLPKKQKSENQPKDVTKDESEPLPPAHYNVGGENNLVVHAPSGCTFNIYQNKAHQGGASSSGGSGDGSGIGGGSSGRTSTKTHAIAWAGATTETDGGPCGEGAGSSIPIPVFRDMSKSIARKWKFLARQLPMVEYGLLETELKVLDACSGSDIDKSLAVLTKWWRENPDNWDAEKMKKQLEAAFNECQLVRLARNIDDAFSALSM